MPNANFTIAYNHILRDKSLPLSAKGLYLVISSYIGMPGWKLTKRELAKVCGTGYAMEKAWNALLDAGYLKHYCSRSASGAYIHRYELMQEPSADAPYRYTADADFAHGDCRMVLSHDSKRDFTLMPNAILRSKHIPLAVKGLFGLVAHLANIPNFSINPAGVQSFCKERIKHFSSVWRQLKLVGLLKQHRYPTGIENAFEYQYEILDEPDTETPYLVNHHADGSVSTQKLISEYITRAGVRLKRLLGITDAQQPHKRLKNAVRKTADRSSKTPPAQPDSRTAALREQIDADTLAGVFAPELVDMTVKALSDLAGAPVIKVGGAAVPQADRKAVVERVTRADISAFLRNGIDLSCAKNPAAYLRSVLYATLTRQTEGDKLIAAWHAKWDKPKQDLIAGAAEPSEPPLADWEQAWLAQVADRRERRRAAMARGEEV